MSESPDTRFDDLALTEAERQLAASALVPADLSTVLGDGDDNVLSGGPDSDVIAGFGGDDAISGRAGSDLLAGGFGDDTLRGGPGDDALFGGTGNDDVSGAAGNDLVSGGAGDDTLTGGTGDDSVLGGLGADEIRGGAGDDTLAGGLGRDLLAGGAGDDLVLGGLGDDTLTGAAGDDTLLGGAGDDSLAGGAGDDTLRGGSGEDTLAGGAGDDLLAGDGGSDELRGGAGDDDLRGGAGDDALRGGAGADTLDGGVGADTLLGGGGDDVLNSDGADALRGGGGIDTARFDTEAPVFVDLGAGLVDSIDIAAGPETDLAEPGATPSAVPLGLGVNRVENKVVNGVPPGGAALDEPPTDIDVFTITVPDGAVLTQLILSGFASTDNLGFIAIQEGEALTTDFSAAEPDVSGLIGLANFGVEPFPNADLGDDILPALASGGGLVPPEDFLPFDPEVGLPAGTYTIQVQQLGAASVDYALDFVIEATDGAETGFGTISGVENVIGSAFDDVLIGNGAANALEGAGGDDLIQGDGGDDSVSGDAGDDVLSGGAGDDLVAGGDGDDSVSGDDGDDNLSGDAGNDTLDGGAGADTLSGGDGDDSLVSDGADAIFGGAGTDTADFSGLTEGATGGAFSGVIVDLDVNSAGAAGTESEDGAILNLPPAAGGAQIGDLEVDDVENVIGSDFDDGLFGNNEDNLLAGGAGDDIMHGFDGDDTLDGGDGTDTALFSAAGSGVFADLAAGTAQTVIGGPGFITQQSAQFVGENGFAVRPIVTMGDALPSSGAINPSQDDFDGPGGTYNPIGVMDGIGAIRLNDTTVRVIQNHEVDDDQAFAYKVNVGTENEIELVGSRMSFYDIDIATKTVVDSGIAFDTVFVSELQEDGTLATVIADDIEQLRKDDFAGDPVTAPGGLDGFDRWCSGIMVVGQEDAVNGAIEGTFASGSGVEDTLWFAGEEVDNGNFYTLDPLTGDLYQLPFFGRGSWEGATQVDTGDASTVAFFLSDDDFPVNSLYLYVGEKVPEGEIDPDDPNAFLKKNGLVDGELYVWVPDANLDDDPDNDVTGEDIADAGATMSGQYVKLNNFQPDMAGEPGFDENGFVLQGELRAQAVELGAVFFSRTEDTSTNPEDGTEIVFANTGSPFDGDIEIDPTGGETGGRSIAFTSNTENPPDGPFDNAGGILTQNFDFSAFNAGTGNVKAVTKVIYDGDTDPAVALRSPDNLDWADDGLIYVQEDEAFPFEFGDPADIGPNTNESSIVALNPNVIDANGNAETLRVGQVNRDAAVPVGSFDNDPTDPGEVETSGVVDVSKLFGEAPGTLFLADVQAHTLENGPIREDELTEGSQLFFFGTPDAVATPAIETDTLVDIENITGSAFDDVLLGGAGDNVLSGGAAGDDTLAGRGGDDTLTGGVGDDLLLPGEGIDVADGGEGDDTVSFSDVAIPEDDDFGDGLGIPADVPDDFNNDDDTGVLVDLGAGTATFTVTTGPDTSETSETTLISIENAEGSFDQDTLIGGEGENRLDGLEGDDLLIGSEGDTLIGDDGDDTLQGTATSALLDGGDGDDTADFSGEESGLVIDLSAGTASTDPGIELLGSQEIPTGTEFGGTEIGGLSGLEFIPAFGTYLALSDDQGFDDPSRFYTLALDIDEDGFDAVNFFAVTTLLDFGEGGGFSTFEPGTVDPESIRFDPTSMTAFVTSEADADTLTPPSVREYTLGGIPLDEFGLPEGFAPTEDGTTGVVPNLAFESLTFSPDGAFLFTATEGALTQDGAPATVDAGSPSRIVKYDAATGEPVAQFIYEVEPIPVAPEPEDAFADNGLVELLALDDDTLLAMERSFAVGVGNTIKLFTADLSGASDVSDLASIVGEDVTPVEKQFVFDFADLGIPLDNIEGITFGPDLPDGRKTLVVVSDNNFSDAQTTLFIALSISGDLDVQSVELVDIESVVGTAFADEIIGSDDDNTIDAGAGDDVILASGGDDAVEGGEGDDRIVFDGVAGAFMISRDGEGNATVEGSDGTTTTTGVETLVFDNLEVDLTADPVDASGEVELSVLGTFATGIFDEGAQEIPAFDPETARLFVTNGDANTIDVLDISDPTTPTLAFTIDVGALAAEIPGADGVNSVAVANGIVAAAIANEDDTAPGFVAFFDADGVLQGSVEVGVLPDAVTFTPDGTKLVVANEGEPDGDVNPLGSISIITLADDLSASNVTTLDFTGFEDQKDALAEAGVLFQPGATLAESLEPEFAAVSPDGTTAFVNLQENNAFAIVDLATETITEIVPLGTVDHSAPFAGLDVSEEDGGINIVPQPLQGLFQPDGIAAYTGPDGRTFYVTANEGDAFPGDDENLEDLTLDPDAFPDAAALQDEAALGDLEVSAIAGDTDGDGDLDELFSFGGRSFSIWDEAGTLVFNSGDMFEQITAAEFPEFFNADNDDNDLDSRSPDAGPEPEGVAVGVIDGQTYAFIGLERIGGIVVYNVTDPVQPSFVQYINNRDFTVEPGAEEGDPLDLGPEGLVFISAEDSPTGQPLLAVANEVSGTTTIYGIDLPDVSEPPAVAINEIRIDQPGEDVSEFFELAGEAGTSLDGLTYVVLGDGAGGSGTVETAVDLSGLTLGEDGLFLAVETAESFVSPSVPDLVTALNFENSDNVTHLLVEGFSGTDDADADDDGVLDDGFGTVIDSVALIETPGEGDNTFSDVTVGPDGPFVPGQVFRETDVTGDFAIGEFTFGVDDTPGLPNEGFVADGTLPNGVASGDVTAGAAVLWARAADAGTVTFEVSTTADFTDIVETVEVEVDDPLVPAKTKVEGLDADTEYFYRATDADGATSAGRFATAAAAGTTAGLTFGVSGDWRGELSPYPAVSNVAEAELDFFLLHGDTIYADFASPSVPAEQATTLDEYLVKHEEVYSERLGENYWAEVRASTSVFATIDDHEVTNDFAGGATVEEQATEIDDVDFGGAPGTLINDSPLYDTGLDAFQAYNPIEDLFFDAPGNELFDGERMLFRSQRYGDDAQFIVLDQRSFRDIQLEAPDVSDFSTIPPFLAASLAEDRTLLGDVQFDMLKTELLAAEEAGVTWKFVSTPEPIQNIGLNSPDAWEGYANERAELLAFIEDEDIDNVVFIAADVHATFVNNLTYQDPDDPLGIAGPQLSSSAFEVTTGSVAFEPPTGEAILLFAAGAGLFSDEQLALLETLPVAPDADDIIDDRDDFLTAALEDLVLNPFGLDPLGLEDNLPGAEGLFDVELLAGDYVTAFNFGWTEFDVDPETQALTVTTFGVPPYVQADLAEDPEAILALEPQIVSQFVVNPQGDDDDGLTTIADVQGAGHISPLLGETVTVEGIVTAVDSNGFYVQDPVGDGDDATSEAIFVFTSDAPTVAVGDAVSLTGEVSEFIPGGAGTGNLSTTQFAFPDITVLSSGNDLPEAVMLGAAGRTPPTDVVISESEAPTEGAINLQDVPGTFNPDVDGIDFYESLEGMRVTIDDPVTVSATNVFGETWTVVDDGANVTGGSPDGGLNERGGINLNADVDGFGDLNPERVQIQFDSGILPDFDLDLTIGADLSDVTGVVGYSFGNFEVLATEAFEVETPSPLTQEVTELVGTDDQLSVVTYNVLNVTSATGTGDSGDDDAEQIAALADQFVFNLGSPDIIALQEIQDDGGEADGADDGILSADETLTAIVDAISAAGGPEYQFASAIVDVAGETGGVPGGNIRNAYLWNPERVTASEITTLEVEELTELGVTEPTTFDGTRDPLLGVFEFGGEEVTLINNHLSSRFGSDPIFGGPQLFEQGGEAAREAETLALNEVVDALLADDPDADIVVLGDLNTFEFTDELTEDLPGVGDDRVLSNLITETLTGDDAYTFVFQGNSQVLDHIFVTDGLLDTAEVDIVHVNTDFPDFASDHEPVIALLTLSGEGDTPLA